MIHVQTLFGSIRCWDWVRVEECTAKVLKDVAYVSVLVSLGVVLRHGTGLLDV